MEHILNEPLAFEPRFKPVIWGGTRIRTYKGLPASDEKIGESWEISALPGSESVVARGPYAGLTLPELATRFGAQLLGEAVNREYGGKFPLLVKLIDADADLSVQVHPDDELALRRHGSLGKSEMWYIIETRRDARIYAGLNRSITADEYVGHVGADTFAGLLAEHKSAPGDVFFLPAGRVHAIGAGNMLAEIQESSDITYRIYDYGRRDAAGRTRELHVDEARDAIDFEARPDYRSRIDDAKCKHFSVQKIELDGESVFSNTADSFLILMCLKGKAEILASRQSGYSCILREGHTVLCPATMRTIRLDGNATLLAATSGL